MSDDPTLFTLWDLDDANLIGSFTTESAALETVRWSVEVHGLDSMLNVGLGKADDTGRTVAVAEGSALIELAQRDGERRIA